MGGDEDLSLIHFKKHYRLNYPMIPDNMDQARHIIRVSGINNVAIFGGDGVCVYNMPDMGANLKDFQKVIDKALKKIKGPNLKKKAYVEKGTVYAPEVKKDDGKIVHERMPALAAGPGGELFMAYVSDKSGSNDIYLKVCTKGKWGKAIPVAAGKEDEYAPTVAATGDGNALVAYVGMTRGRYEVFTVTLKKGKASKPRQLTKSKDDAMGPRLARGEDNNLWLTWYEWAKMGDLSRDREIFLARSKGGGSFSKPVQISPKDVKSYEDHAEPVVASDGKGGAWVAWAWDYHGTLKDRPPVDENSIFLRHVDKRMKLGKILAAGFRGEGRARDYVPTLAVTPDGIPWVAWDNSHKSSLGYSAKAIFVNHLAEDDFHEQEEAAAWKGPIDTPCFAMHPEKGLYLLWGRWNASGWELCSRAIESGSMGKETVIEVKGKTPRYPAACFDAKGTLWVAYTDTASKEWKVRVEKVR